MNLFGGRVADPKLDGLRRASVFAECSAKELEWVASRMDEVKVAAGQQLTHQGSPGHSFYILLEGEAQATIDGQPVATLRPGDFFGEISMLDRGPATATITTSTEAALLVMSHGQFRDAIRSNETLLNGVMSAMAARLRANLEAGFSRPS
ncbi:MAG TPA: cyclic nucleotide-binding domain-containing protein [Candidatus Dormibacteraeota bacterium]|jgi:CRP-like cAMP-binding protein|nr:cyclic nucleotide-binding domain-containing protein [Candidatus Dormibacteraeota bacterium]